MTGVTVAAVVRHDSDFCVGVYMGHGWILIECMGNGEPTLVFDRVRPRRYSSIRRRDNLRSPQVTAALLTMVGDVTGSRSTVRRVLSADKNESLMMVGHPVEGPGGSVYGVQVWVGLEHELPPPAGWSERSSGMRQHS